MSAFGQEQSFEPTQAKPIYTDDDSRRSIRTHCPDMERRPTDPLDLRSRVASTRCTARYAMAILYRAILSWPKMHVLCGKVWWRRTWFEHRHLPKRPNVADFCRNILQLGNSISVFDRQVHDLHKQILIPLLWHSSCSMRLEERSQVRLRQGSTVHQLY